MAVLLSPESLRGYMGRDWSAAREAKLAYWEQRRAAGGLREILRITDELRRWMIARVPGWPTQRDREEDLETHRRVAQALAKTKAPRPTASGPRTRSRARRVR